MTHLSMFQVYINILIFPMGKNPRGDISPQEFFPAGIFPHGDFFSSQYSSLEDLIQWKSIFSAFIHIYIVYGMDPAQLLHVVVKQAGKLYLRFTWSQTQRQFFTLCCPYICIHSKAAPVRATCLFHLEICSLCKEFRSRSGPTSRVQITGSKLFDIVEFFFSEFAWA